MYLYLQIALASINSPHFPSIYSYYQEYRTLSLIEVVYSLKNHFSKSFFLLGTFFDYCYPLQTWSDTLSGFLNTWPKFAFVFVWMLPGYSLKKVCRVCWMLMLCHIFFSFTFLAFLLFLKIRKKMGLNISWKVFS